MSFDDAGNKLFEVSRGQIHRKLKREVPNKRYTSTQCNKDSSIRPPGHAGLPSQTGPPGHARPPT